MHEELLKKALSFDPLETAETMTGERVDEGGKAFGVGFVLAQGHAKLKKTLLQARADIYDGISIADFTAIVVAAGFEKVLEIPFVATEYGGGRRDEIFIVFAHRAGLILRIDSYGGIRINDGAVYYNWRPQEGVDYGEYVSSGGMIGDVEDRVWHGDHNAREALLFNLDQLRANGEFVTPWIKPPFLWLLHYGDTADKTYDYVAINRLRIAMLPDWVREIIGEY